MKIVLDPYETTMGKSYSMHNARQAIARYVAGAVGNNLNYEISDSNKCRIVFITGYDEDERTLPILEQPMIVTDGRGFPVIVADVRKYLKLSTGEQPISLKPIFKDDSTYRMVILQTLLMKDFTLGNLGVVKSVDKNFCSAFTLFISNLFNHIVNLNPIEKLHVEMVIAHYFYSMNVADDDVEDMVETIRIKISKTNLSLTLPNIKTITEILSVVNNDVQDFNGLVDNIKSVLPEEKRAFINSSVLFQKCTNLWYGPGGDNILLMGLESYPSMVALLYTAMLDKTYKRSMLSTMLDKFSGKTKPAEIEKVIASYVEDRMTM